MCVLEERERGLNMTQFTGLIKIQPPVAAVTSVHPLAELCPHTLAVRAPQMFGEGSDSS